MTPLIWATIINWSILLLLYLCFSIWHGAFEGPLTPAEIEEFANQYKILNPKEDVNRIRAFMESDKGKAIYMINTIKLYDRPQLVNGKKVGDTSAEILNNYSKHVMSFLLKRGSYPTYSGRAIFDSVENWGVGNAEKWTSGAIIRYRSLRVMMEMVTEPSFQKFHDYKIAAMEKTISYPTIALLNIGSLSTMVAFILIILGLIVQLVIVIRF